jgi:glutamate synthase (ferredoxin)
VRVRADGGLKSGRVVVVAALLGAGEGSCGSALRLAAGWVVVRSCHLDTCPVGIATQRPELRSKFAATPDQIETYLRHVAGEVRELLASLGLRTFADAVGRSDLLARKQTSTRRAASLDLSPLVTGPHGAFTGERALATEGGELGTRLAEEAEPILEEERIIDLQYAVSNRDRAVGARLGVEIGRRFGSAPPPGRLRARFTGSAGQSFGAFLSAGVDLELIGEANDYVGKGMGGGRIVVVPPPGDAGDPVLLGNTVLYGATGGELFCAGRAGERFGVRNSGAVAVVEGLGDHGCEYMTAGLVAVLGPVGMNFAAGMSGGVAYVLDPAGTLPLRLNGDLAAAERGAPDELRDLLDRHLRHTSSPRAAELLRDWPAAAAAFWCVSPRSLEGAAERDALELTAG